MEIIYFVYHYTEEKPFACNFCGIYVIVCQYWIMLMNESKKDEKAFVHEDWYSLDDIDHLNVN